MLKLICVEFKKLRRRREVLFMLLAAFIMPAVSLFYFYTHRDMLTDIGLYKQAILSFNIFLILPALLGILSATIVYREQADDVFKQLLIIPLKKEQLMLAKWAVTLVFSEAFMIISTLFTISVGLCLNLVSRYSPDCFCAFKGNRSCRCSFGFQHPDFSNGLLE